jgi:hypothetical protein
MNEIKTKELILEQIRGLASDLSTETYEFIYNKFPLPGYSGASFRDLVESGRESEAVNYLPSLIRSSTDSVG